MQWTEFSVDSPEDVVWDAVVVGTGAGGGPAGLTLARQGLNVLFLERGKPPTERSGSGRIDSGWWPDTLRRVGDLSGDIFAKELLGNYLPIGCGVGGSTSLHNLTMDRFRSIDFRPRSTAPPSVAALVPSAWPLEYEELEPYYREAEALFRLHGTDDPLAPVHGPLLDPLAPSDAERAVHRVLTESGLHPYRIHTASDRVENCGFCLLRQCSSECRNDTGRMCVEPTLRNHGAKILTECYAIRLETKGRDVTQVVCHWKGKEVAIRARLFALALHSLLTPALLLRSANTDFPHGLGNTSGLVGRNLMLHASDLIAVEFEQTPTSGRPLLNHGISLNDFYVVDGIKLGNVHVDASPEAIVRSGPRLATVTFATVVEDYPYAENRIIASYTDPYDVSWEYKYPPELRSRCDRLIGAFSAALASKCTVRHLNPPPLGNLNVAHACGTCRFGNDPRTSVLDRNNRVHDLGNLLVLDASFFPSSGGMNPSLTIAANSIRATTHIASATGASGLA